MDKDYNAKRRSIQSHVGKNEAKPPLAQEFEYKTIPTCKPIQEPLLVSAPPTFAPPASTLPTLTLLAPVSPASASADQKSQSNLLNGQKRPMLAAKDSKYQVSNPDTFYEKVQIIQIVQEVNKPRSCSLSAAFNESTDSRPVISLSFDTQYTTTFDLVKLYNQDIK